MADEQRKTVFISCGQYTDEEKELGKRVSDLVTKTTPFEGYFAQAQTTLETLSENILRRLHESVGLIVIMHHRGRIEGRNTIRASVWIEQEVAIATLMQQVLGRSLHVALFIQKGIALEGIRQQIQLNAVEFTSSDEVIARLREILPTWKESLYIADEERQRVAKSVMLTIRTGSGLGHQYTIQVENHSKTDAEIKCISLWGKGKSKDFQKVSKPAFPPDGTRWSAPGQRLISIEFDAKEDVALGLWKLIGSPHLDRRIEDDYVRLPGQFETEVRVELLCEIMGIERPFEETRTVQVDFTNRQIRGLT